MPSVSRFHINQSIDHSYSVFGSREKVPVTNSAHLGHPVLVIGLHEDDQLVVGVGLQVAVAVAAVAEFVACRSSSSTLRCSCEATTATTLVELQSPAAADTATAPVTPAAVDVVEDSTQC